MNKFSKMLWLLPAAAVISLSSCADGFEEESNFDSGVHHKQLESPATANAVKEVNSSGDDIYTVTWPVVLGAGGYQVNVDIYDDPTNPESVCDTIINGCKLQFKIKEDTKYNVQIKTLANSYWKQTDNKDAVSANAFLFNTAVPGYTIPEGTDIAKFINDFFAQNDSLAQSGCEVAFELEAGKNYTLDTLINTTLANVTLRGDKVKHSIVTLGQNGGISIYGGFKLKFLYLDCSAATTESGILGMGKEKYEELYYKYNPSGTKCANHYQDLQTILIQDCVLKSIPKSLIWDGGAIDWCVKDFRVVNSYIEMNPDDSKLGSDGFPCINFVKTGCSFKGITFTNSTFVYLKKTNCYFMRFKSASDSNPAKAFGESDATNGSAQFKMDHCTMVRSTTNGQFGNNTWYQGGNYTMIDWKGCIFYDTNLLQKLVRTLLTNFNNGNNTIWQVSTTVDSTDKTKYATEEDPMFEGGDPDGDVIEGWDFTKENGGLNFKPTNGIAADNKYGDPRWFGESAE